MKPLSPLRLLALSAIGFAISVVTNTVDPFLYNHKIRALVPGMPNTALGWTSFATLLVAIVTQPVIGVLSDRTQSRWGRRLPYLTGGTLLVILCLFAIALAPDLALLVIAMLALSFSSNTVQGPFQALIPDQVPEEQRGQASGIKGVFDILAVVTGGFVAGQLVGRYQQWGTAAILAAVAVPSAIFLVALGLTAASARERSIPARPGPQRGIAETLIGAFTVDFSAHPQFVWWFLNRLFFWSAFVALRTFLPNFLVDVLGMSLDEATRTVGTVTVVLGAAIAVVSFPAGWLADRVGRRPLVIASGLLATAGILVTLSAINLTMIIVGGGIAGLAAGIFITSNWALITDIVPREEAARYLGVANIATAGGSALARALGALLIDPLNAWSHSTSAGYLIYYGIGAAFFVLGTLAILRLPGRRVQVGTAA